MIKKPNGRSASVLGIVLLVSVLGSVDAARAQMLHPAYAVPTPAVRLSGSRFRRHHARQPSSIPVQATVPSYYAPQVPVVPMSTGPVPTMSAFYIPSVPVTTTFRAPVVRTGVFRRSSGAVLSPAMVHPIYWNHQRLIH